MKPGVQTPFEWPFETVRFCFFLIFKNKQKPDHHVVWALDRSLSSHTGILPSTLFSRPDCCFKRTRCTPPPPAALTMMLVEWMSEYVFNMRFIPNELFQAANHWLGYRLVEKGAAVLHCSSSWRCCGYFCCCRTRKSVDLFPVNVYRTWITFLQRFLLKTFVTNQLDTIFPQHQYRQFLSINVAP